MQNIIKALNYQTRRDNFTYIMLVIAIAAMVLVFGMNLSSVPFEELTGGTLSVNMSDAGFFAFSIFCVLLPARICGWDFNDKTINYELLTGHSKKHIFFGRVIVSLLWVMGLCAATLILPILFCTVVNGWGPNISASGTAMRFAMLIFPVFRAVCEMILVTFLLRNCYGAMILGWLGYEFSLVISMAPKDFFYSDLDISLLFSSSTLTNILTFSNYKLGYVNGEDVQVFETALSDLHFYGTIGTSLGVGCLCLAAAYLLFKKRDMP